MYQHMLCLPPLLPGSGAGACLRACSVLGLRLMVKHTLQCLVLRHPLYPVMPAQVEQLSDRAQAVIQRYAGAAGALAGAHAGMCAVTGMLPWAHPTSQEYEELARVAPCCFLLLGL